jgi:putative protease
VVITAPPGETNRLFIVEQDGRVAVITNLLTPTRTVCGVDAVIVQDPAVAILAAHVCPDLRVHASTQMTISSPSGMEFAKYLGVKRVVLPRELTLSEVQELRSNTDLELEVFVHGALCVSYSGQCLTSEVWGQRSANPPQCAQSCRMPYSLVVDGEVRDLGDVRYLLSPKDQAALQAIPHLLEMGINSLKIEGRQKSAHYVATAVRTYRTWVDFLSAGGSPTQGPEVLAESVQRMGLAYTRGFSDGFLNGVDHQDLVEGRFPKHRGFLLGMVTEVAGKTVWVKRAERTSANETGFPILQTAPTPIAGMGVVFDQGNPESKEEPGGRIFQVEDSANGFALKFGIPGPDLSRVRVGDRVWLSGDHHDQAATDRLIRLPEPSGRIGIDVVVSGNQGSPLQVTAQAGFVRATVCSPRVLEIANHSGLDKDLLVSKLLALGGTPFRMKSLDRTALDDGLFLPVAELKALRRELVAELRSQVERGPARSIAAEEAVKHILAEVR